MRAILRRYLAPLAVAGAVLSAAPAFASAATVPAAHPGIAVDHHCPPGTNWDSALQACV